MNLDLVELFKRDDFVHYIQIPLNKVFMFGANDTISLIALFDEKNTSIFNKYYFSLVEKYDF